MTNVPDPTALYALSHAAFGAIAVMAMGYVVMLAGKLEERNLAAEASTQPDIVGEFKASGGAAVVPYYVYVYSHKDAEVLSTRLYSMRLRLTLAYLGCLFIAFLVQSSGLQTFIGIEDVTVVSNAAQLLGLPKSLMAPFGFTAYVVVELWLATREFLKLLRHGRSPSKLSG